MVAITANVNTDQLGRDSFQEVDIVNIVKPITKASFLVERVEDLAPTIRKAFALANHGRKGPVLLDVPKDLTAQTTDYEPQEPIPPELFRPSLSRSRIPTVSAGSRSSSQTPSAR